MDDAHGIELARQLDAVRAEELRSGRGGEDLAGALRRSADRGLAILRAVGGWSEATSRLWEGHLVDAESTACQEAPSAYERLRNDLAIESELPWTRATLLRLTPELISLDWGPVDEQEPVEQVADALAQNERIQRKLWLGSKVEQDLRAELREVVLHDPQAAHLARRLRKLGVTRLAVENTGWRSVAHDREVDPGLHERIDLTALEARFTSHVKAWRTGQVPASSADQGQLTALEPGHGATLRRFLQRLTGLVPSAWRGPVIRYLARAGRPPKTLR
jgi:hypothetical protein